MYYSNRQSRGVILFRKLYVYVFVSILALSSFSFAGNLEQIKEIRQQAIALYSTQNYNEAFELLNNLPKNEKTEDDFLLIANIYQEKNDDNAAIQSLNKALAINPSFYKAYYNLGCILAARKSYLLASNNFELAIKHNKTFSSAYYNLACCQIKLKNYDLAKKNLLKAIELDPSNKDYYFNLAYCYKELKKEKQAKKILDVYNQMS